MQLDQLMQNPQPLQLTAAAWTQAAAEDCQSYHLTDYSAHLRLLTIDELTELLPVLHLHQITCTENIMPLWTNGHSDYIGVYVSGTLQGKICYLDHEESDLAPVFRTVHSFLTAVQQHPNTYWEELPHDYPSDRSLSEQQQNEDIACIHQLLTQLEQQQLDDQERCMLLYSVMALTPYTHLDSLMPYLEDDGMYVQERACAILGHHCYVPAQPALEKVAQHGMHNGQLAAKIALSRIQKWKHQNRSQQELD